MTYYNWDIPTTQITEHFTVKDCLYLHAWQRLATSADGADFTKLIVLCQKLEEIRTILNCPMNVTSMFRSEQYNLSQGIKPALDVHQASEACDFDCHENLTILQIKEILIPKLQTLNIRLEKGTTTWIHVDVRDPGPSGRYFTP